MMHFHTNPISGQLVQDAAELNNQAMALSRQGDDAGSERLHLRALDLKLRAVGENNSITAITLNALGELYLKMGRISDAEEQLKKAVSVRMKSGTAFDAAVSVENLGRVHEEKGDLEEARRVRLSNPDHVMVCGNSDVGTPRCISVALANCGVSVLVRRLIRASFQLVQHARLATSGLTHVRKTTKCFCAISPSSIVEEPVR